MERIDSLQNPRVKYLVRLRDRRHRDADRRFLIEGYRELDRAREAGIQIETLYVAEELFLGSNEPDLVAAFAAGGAEVIAMAEAPFRKASYRDRPEGLLAVAHQFPTGIERLDELPPDPLVFVAESIEKPGNLGTMLRTADAAGVAVVIVADPTTDPFNPNVVRASLGNLFSVPLVVTSTSEAITALRARGIRLLAATPAATTLHHEADLTGPIALVVGSEQYGLSDSWLDGSDLGIRIPMAGRADSLNAAMAAGVLLFEAVRQRSF